MNDVIPILRASETEAKRLALRIKALRDKGLTHSLKKIPGLKKRKKEPDVKNEPNGVQSSVREPEGNGESDNIRNRVTTPENATKPAKNSYKSSSSLIRNAATASLTVKVLQEQEERNKRRKMDKNANLATLFSKSDPRQLHVKNKDFMSRGFSIPTQSEK